MGQEIITPRPLFDRLMPDAPNEEIYRAHLVANLALVLGAGILLVLVLTAWLALAGSPPLMWDMPLMLAGGIICGLVLWLNRTGRTRMAARLLVGFVLVAASAMLYSEGHPPTDPAGALSLMLSSVLAMALLRRRGAWLIWASTWVIWAGINLLWLGDRLPPNMRVVDSAEVWFLIAAWAVISGTAIVVIDATFANQRRHTETLAQQVAGRRHAEEAMHGSDAQMQAILQALPDVMFRLSEDGIHLDFYAPKLDQLLVQPDEFIGRTVGEVLPDEIAKKYMRHIRKALRSGQTEVFEYELDFAEDDTRVFEARLVTSGKNEVLAVVRNITGEVRAQEALQRSLEETTRNQLLLLALSQAAQAVQRARTPAGVHQTVLDEISKLGYEGSIFTLTDDREHLALSYSTFGSRAVRAAEKLTGLKRKGFRFRLDQDGFFHTLIRQGEAAFIQPGSLHIDEALPRAVRPLAGRVADMLGLDRVIYAPLIVAGETHGLMTVIGDDLTEADLPAVAAFANQTAIAIENAQLYEQAQQEIAERKQAEESLRESENRQRALFEHASDSIFISDPVNRRFVDFNEIAASRLGYTREELLELSINDISPTFPPERLRELIRSQQEGETHILESAHRRKDGTEMPVEISTRAVAYGDQQVILSFARDITERKQVEEALRESEERYRALIDGSPNSITALQDGRIVFINPGGARMLGYPNPDDVVGLAAMDLIAPEYHAMAAERLEQVAAGQSNLPAEIGILKSDGGTMIMESMSIPIALDNRPATLIVAQDITERKQAEEQIGYQARLLENVSDAVLSTDMSFVVQSWNQAAEEMYGWKAAEAIGRQSDELLQPDYGGSAREDSLDSFLEGGRYTGEIIHHHKDGTPINVWGSVSTLLDADGSPKGVVSINRDITERVRSEAELAHRARQQAAVARLGQRALAGTDVSVLMDEVVALVSQTLDVPLCKVLEIVPEGDALLLRTGVGWLAGLVGEATVPTETDSQAGYTLISNQPVIVEDLSTEKRFSGPALLTDHNVVSGMSVIIPGRERPFGVLGAHTTIARSFSDEDANFLQALANVLAAAIERRQAEDALRESEERYRSLVANMNDGLMRVGSDEQIEFVNDRFCEMVGYAYGELIGKVAHEFLVPDEDQRIIDEQIALREQNLASRYEIRLRKKSGELIWIQVSGAPVMDEEGNLVGSLSINTDITERKKAEEALRDSEERFRRLSEAAFEGIGIADQGKVIDVSERLAEMLGSTRSELIGSSVMDIVAPESRELVLDRIRSGYDKPYEHMAQRKDGSIFPVEVRGKVIPYEGRTVRVTAIRDITERKQAEEALRESEERFRQTINSIRSHVYVTHITEDGEFTNHYKSPGYKALTGYATQEFVDDWNLWHTLIHPDDREQAANNAHKLAQGYDSELEYRIVRADGEVIWVLDVARVVSGEDDTHTVYGTITDVTERKQAEEALRESEERFRQTINSIRSHVYVTHIAEGGEFTNQYLSPGCETLTGYATQELIDDWQLWHSIIHPDDRERSVSNSQKLAHGQDSELEYRIVQADGEVIWVLDVARVVSGENNTYTIYGTITDVTERKQAEEALRESEEKFRLISEQALLGIAIIQDGKIKYANQAVADINGYSVEEMLAWEPVDFGKLIHPDDAAFAIEQARRKQAGDEDVVPHYSYRLITKTGEVRRVDQYSKTIVYEGRTADLATIIDITERVRAEDALRESEERYRALVEASPTSIIALQEGRIAFANPAAARMLVYSDPDEVVGLLAQDTVAPDFQEMVDKRIEQGTAGQENPLVEMEIVRHDGSPLLIESTSVPITLNEKPAMLVIGRDITERKQAEQALRHSEQLYRSLFENMQSGFAYHQIVTDADGNPIDYIFLELNEAFEDMTGLKRADVVGRSITDVLPGITQADFDWIGTYGKVALTGEAIQFQHYYPEPLNRWYNVAAYSPAQDHFAVIFHDVSEQVRAVEALRESEERYRTLVMTTPYGIQESNREGIITFSNPAHHQIQGYDDGEIEGMRIWDFLESDQERESLQEYYKQLVEKEPAPAPYSSTDRTKDGRVIYTSINWDYIRDAKGEVVAICSVIDDITERKRVEDALRDYRGRLEEMVKERTTELIAANERLEALGRAKDEFVAGVSHELRTPITNIKLYHHLLSQHPDESESYLGTLKRETARLERLVQDILDLSRFDQGQLPLTLEPVDLNAMIDLYVSDRVMLAALRDQTLVFARKPGLPVLQLDPKLFEQVLNVLLENAFHYTPADGRIMVSTELRADDGKRWAGLTVSDTGEGIPPDEIDRVFERFFRGKSSLRLGLSGAGLGLALAKEIVERHGGSIEVVSEGKPGKGTVFSVWLPIAE
jgi:PAS domain S-box-containing protein